MCFRRWRERREAKQREEEEARQRQEEAEKEAQKKAFIAAAQENAAMRKEEEKPEVKTETSVQEPQAEEPKPEEKKPEAKKVEKPAPKAKPADNRYTGKYEVYPEAGMYKFRLKASNGEILLVSNCYKTQDGAIKGIDTIKKNLALGNSIIVTDKKGFSQFRFNTANNARLIIAGEYYNTVASCQSALESTKKFAETDKIVKLDKIPASEVREEIIQAPKVEAQPNGKLEIFVDDEKKFRGRLIASNGEILFVTNDYATKQGVILGLKAIKQNAAAGEFSLCRDKQNRYQFRLYSDNSQMILVGETYSSKDAAASAVESVIRFLPDCSIVDVTNEKKEAQ
jgi:uncharacterized protein YegP (UPF0339 family)